MIAIIGAGASGLMAAKELLQQGQKVIMLEAADRIGGRLRTAHNPAFQKPLEEGAEFVHGKLPLTLQLLKEAGISYQPVTGDMIRISNGKWHVQEEFTVGWDELIRAAHKLDTDMTVSDFLKKNFSGPQYAELRNSVIRLAQGFDVADPDKASMLILANEWIHEGDQFRLPGGSSDKLVNYLEERCKSEGAVIYKSTVVKNIQWKRNDVKVFTSEGKIFSCSHVVITVPLGVLQADAGHTASVSFEPPLHEYMRAASQIGFGSVIKIFLEFKNAFWNNYAKNVGFIFSEEVVPTWWTQLPDTYPLLTGWMGGPQTAPVENADKKTILHLALKSLASIFNTSIDSIHNVLKASHIVKWRDNALSLGAYSYNMLNSANAKALLNTPVDDTIYLAGEALYAGNAPGTVEAALVSGKTVASELLQKLKIAQRL